MRLSGFISNPGLQVALVTGDSRFAPSAAARDGAASFFAGRVRKFFRKEDVWNSKSPPCGRRSWRRPA